MRAEAPDLPLHFRRTDVKITELAPVHVLALGDQRQHWIVLPPCRILQRWNVDVQNGKHKVVAAKLGLAGEKRFKLEPAIRARYHGRRDDRNKKRRLRDGGLNLTFPQRAGGNRLLVLPEAEGLGGAAEEAAQ